VSTFDDDQDVRRIPDEQLLTGVAVRQEPELSAFVAGLRATADDEAPVPSAALHALLRDGLPASPAPGDLAEVVDLSDRAHSARRGWRRVGAVAGATVAVKVALAGAAAATVVIGAAQLEQAPAVIREPAQAVVGAVVDAWHSATGAGAPPAEPSAPVVSPAPLVPNPNPNVNPGPDPNPNPNPGPDRNKDSNPKSTPACGDGCGDEASDRTKSRPPRPSTPGTDAPGRSRTVGPPAGPRSGESRGRSQDAPGQERRETPQARSTAGSAPSDTPGRG
jgi:hypothetical protein